MGFQRDAGVKRVGARTMIYGLFWVMSATAVGGAVALYLLSALYLFSAVLALDVVGAMIVRRNGDMKRFSKHRGDAAS